MRVGACADVVLDLCCGLCETVLCRCESDVLAAFSCSESPIPATNFCTHCALLVEHGLG